MVSITTVVALLAVSSAANRGRVLGIYQAALQAGASLSPVVAGIASHLFGWRAAFLVAGVGAVGGVGVVLLLRKPTPAVTPGSQDAERVVHEPRRSSIWLDLLLVNVATFVLFFLTQGLVNNVLPLYGAQLGLDAVGIGLVLSIATGLRFAVSVLGAVASDRIGRHGVLLFGFVLTLVACVLFPFATTLLSFTLLTWLLSIGRLGNAVPIAMLSDRVPRERHGRWVGRNRFIADIAVLVGPICLGVVVDAAGFGAAFAVSAVLVVLVILLMLVESRANGRGMAALAA